MYVVITPQGIESAEGFPSIERIGDLVGGLVEIVRTAMPEVSLWMNEEAFALEEAGRIERNIVGSVLAMAMGAEHQPYPGTLVLTGLRRDPMEGDYPADLPEIYALAALTGYDEISRILAGETLPDVDPEAAEAMHALAALAAGPPMEAVLLDLDTWLHD